jgi:hypothetical protein
VHQEAEKFEFLPREAHGHARLQHHALLKLRVDVSRLETYEPGAAKTGTLAATVSFFLGGVKAFETDPLKAFDGLNARSKAVPLRFSVPLAALEPGRYACQVGVVQPAAQKVAVWRAPMVLLP